MPATEFDETLADEPANETALSPEAAEELFRFFQQSPLFRWSDANNDCEDRANAVCLLLDDWKLPNRKAWVFSGDFRKKEPGNLTNLWNYHVAAAVPVREQNKVVYLVIDPATAPQPVPVDRWALQITESGKSYHFVKWGNRYIFPSGEVTKDNWYSRNRRNFNWTMQGLTGFNGVSIKGKAQLAFHKNKVQQTVKAFRKLRCEKPPFGF